MPTYNYACSACESIEEQIHGMSETPKFICSKCGALMEKKFTPNFGGFIMKGGTPAIHYKEKRQREKKSEQMIERQRKAHREGPKIQPNVAGLEVDSWKDAQKVAKEAGMNSSSYEPWVEKEKNSKLVI